MRLFGPGYFKVQEAEGGELEIDYGRIPKAHPIGWPSPAHNDEGLARFVYGGLHDRVRAVRDGVLIGRASKQGKAMDTWFLLQRE